MNRFATAAAGLLLTMSSTAQGSLHEATVLQFMTAYEQALSTESFDNVAPLVHPDAVFRFSEGDFVGHADIKGAMEKTWGLDVEAVEFFLTDIDVNHTDDSSALVTFNWNWKGQSADGPFHVIGRGTSLVVKHEGTLKLKLEHLSR